MTIIFLVEHRTGGWSGTDTMSIYRAFSTREKADAYVAAYQRAIAAGSRHDNLDQFDITKVFLDDDSV